MSLEVIEFEDMVLAWFLYCLLACLKDLKNIVVAVVGFVAAKSHGHRAIDDHGETVSYLANEPFLKSGFNQKTKDQERAKKSKET